MTARVTRATARLAAFLVAGTLSAALVPTASAERGWSQANRLDAPSGWRETAIRRAGAWGRCVVAAAPTDSRALLTTRDEGTLRRIESRLGPVAGRCLDAVGRFVGDDDRRIRQIAVAEAWRGRPRA